MSPRIFAAIVGGVMLVIGLFALGATVSVEDGVPATLSAGRGFPV